MIIQTKKVLREGEVVIINAADFDPMVHQEFDEVKAETDRIIDEAKKAAKK